MDEIPLLGLAPGALFCASFTDVGRDPDAALDSVDADLLLSLIETPEIHLRFPEFEGWLEDSNGRARRAPIPDGGLVPDEELLSIVDELVADVQEGQRVVLHCGAGMSRTGIVATLVLVRLGVPLEQAATHVRKHRLGAGPDNAEQREQLERLAAAMEAAHPRS